MTWTWIFLTGSRPAMPNPSFLLPTPSSPHFNEHRPVYSPHSCWAEQRQKSCILMPFYIKSAYTNIRITLYIVAVYLLQIF